MMRVVLTHVTTSPCNYISGLQLLSQLLPLPLPLPSPRPLRPDEETEILKARTLWSAHLLPLEPEISRLVSHLSGFVYPPLASLFKHVVAQLTCLAPPTATAVLLAVMRSAYSALNTKNLVVSGRLMGLLAWLTGMRHLKAVMAASIAEETVRTEFSRTLEVCFTQARFQ